MKAIIEFEGAGAWEDARTALDGHKWKLAIWDLDQVLRKKTKYAKDDDNPEVVEALHEIREEIKGILNDYQIQLD